MFAVRATTIRNAAADKSGIVRALPKIPSDPHFRLAQIHDSPVEKVRVIAIEKHPFDSDHPSLTPSFCELKVDHTTNSAIMYIQGQPVIPDSDVLVFMADYGAPPQRVVIDRNALTRFTRSTTTKIFGTCVSRQSNQTILARAPTRLANNNMHRSRVGVAIFN